MGASRLLRMSLAVWMIAGVGACGSDKKHHATVKDAGARDSGDGNDDFDGDVIAPGRPDTGVKVKPGDPDPGLMGACAIDSNKIFTAVMRDDPFSGTPLAVDPSGSVFALPSIGKSSACLDAVYLTTLEGGATAGDPKTKPAIDECALELDAVTTFAGGQWLVATIDNRKPPYDVWVTSYDATTHEMGKAGQRISESSAKENAIVIGTQRDGNTMIAWSDTDEAGVSSLYTRSLDPNGKPLGVAHVIETWTDDSKVDPKDNPVLTYRDLVLAPLGEHGMGLGYWRFDLALTRSEIVFVALDGEGAPMRDPWIISGNAGPFASVAIATDIAAGADSRGGIVYTQAEAGSGRQIWFQEIDDTGQAAGLRVSQGVEPPVRVVNSPFAGIDVGVTKLRSSYLVSYRALPAVNMDQAQIRLYFLDTHGAIVGSSDVAYTSTSGGRTAIQAAYDGRVVLSWSEVDAMTGMSAIKVVRVPCIGG